MVPFIILVVLICIALLVIYIVNQYRNGLLSTVVSLTLNNKVDIGNFLSTYYRSLVLSILEQRDFTYIIPNKPFINKLPSNIPFRQDLFMELSQLGITATEFKKTYPSGMSFWFVKDKLQQDIGYIMKPLLHSLLDTALSSENLHGSANPVIHFRCADTPFIRDKHYHFQKYSFFKDALENNRANKSITLLSCSTHKADQQKQESCKSYTDHLQEYLQSIGYTATVQCNTPEQDFATIFYSPLVISTGSSFSFMSGFFGSGQFISTLHEEEYNKKEFSTCTDCDIWMYKGYNIPHSSVNDYHNIDQVKQLLMD